MDVRPSKPYREAAGSSNHDPTGLYGHLNLLGVDPRQSGQHDEPLRNLEDVDGGPPATAGRPLRPSIQ